MVNKADQARITALLTEAITVLCKNGLAYQAEFSIEGLLGITLDKQDIFLINIKETVQRELHRKAKQDGKGDSQDSDDVEMSADYGSDSEHLTFSSTLEGMMGSLADSKRKRRWSQPENGSAKEDGGKELRNDHHRSRVKEESDSGDESAYDRVPHPHSQRETSLAPGSTTLVGTEGPSATPQLLSGEVMPGGATWDQTLGSSNLTMSQAAVVSTPLLAASMSQMTGIAQPTQDWFMRESMRLSVQLEDQRRKSRDHMRHYRQQLRTTNYTEYEERKRRQREGMRRYRERLRIENPEKYAEMNRKHAEQERRRRLRMRSLSCYPYVSRATATTPQGVMTSEAASGQKIVGPDFLHVAMENSQLLQVREMHQLLQGSLQVGMPGGSLGVAGTGTLTVEDLQQQQQHQQHQQHQQPHHQQQQQPPEHSQAVGSQIQQVSSTPVSNPIGLAAQQTQQQRTASVTQTTVTVPVSSLSQVPHNLSQRPISMATPETSSSQDSGARHSAIANIPLET